MTKFSLNSPHRRTRPFFFLILGFFALIIFVNVLGSLFLHKVIGDTKEQIRAIDGYGLDVRFAYFSVFKGLILAGVELSKEGEPLFASQRIDLGLDVLSLTKRQALIKNIELDKPRFFPERVQDLTFLMGRLFEKRDIPVGFYETAYLKATGASLGAWVSLDFQGYVSVVKGNLLISRGTVLLNKIVVPLLGDSDFFGGSSFTKVFDYVFEGESKEKGFHISRLEFSNPGLKLTGDGRIEATPAGSRLILDAKLMNIVLDDVPFLNREHVQTRGVIDASLSVSGPLEELKVLVGLKMTNTRFTFFDSFFLDKVNGSAVIARDHLIGQSFSLTINDIPFKADFAIYQKDLPRIALQFSSVEKEAADPAFVLNLTGQWAETALQGDINSRLKYSSGDTENVLSFDFRDFRLGYEDDLLFAARGFETRLAVQRADPKEGEARLFDQTLKLAHLFGVVRRQKDGFALDNMRSACYGGTLEGRVDFIPAQNHLDVRGEAHVRDVDLDQVVRQGGEGQGVLAGTLAGDLRFDTALADMFKGQVFISDGLVQRHPVLDAVADFLGVASLKKVKFDDLSMFFTGGRGDYTSQVKLQSPLVNGLLDQKITSYDKMDGYLTISLATQVLNESKQFKKILTYIKHDEPSVVFPFKISAYINSPRVLWLKNEFKEKLQNLLPERNKRFLQGQVNSMVEKIEVE